MQRALSNTSKTIRIPVHIEQRQRKLGQRERELTVKLGRDPSDEEVAAAAEMDVDEVLELRVRRGTVPASTRPSATTVRRRSATCFRARRPDRSRSSWTTSATSCGDALDELPQPERKVIELRFGLSTASRRRSARSARSSG